MEILKQLLRDEEGQGLVEYGIIIGLIAIVCITAVRGLGKKMSTNYTDISHNLDVIPVKPD
jgi:pilus assembly protein Flp/PilA